jgi:hypothetical protein
MKGQPLPNSEFIIQRKLNASERVQVWRKLQRFGSIPFRNAGSLLPNTLENQERFEWLAAAIRASING